MSTSAVLSGSANNHRFGFHGGSIPGIETIPNPGVSSSTRALLAVIVGNVVSFGSYVMLEWPMWIAPSFDTFGSAAIGIAVAVATWLSIRQRKSIVELTIEEFREAGVRPEEVGSVIVESRILAHTILGYSSQWTRVQSAVDMIGNEVLAIVDGFKDDPTDISRCRHNIMSWMNQAYKILQNLEVIERRIANDNSVTMEDNATVVEEATAALEQIARAMTEQHQRNLDNNQNALEVDIQVSDQILR